MSTPITTRFLVGPPELRDAYGNLAAFGDVGDAVAYADSVPGSQVYVCEPMPESGLWEWAVTRKGETPSDRVIYVNERAARNCTGPDQVLWKARAGRSPLRWQPVDAGYSRLTVGGVTSDGRGDELVVTVYAKKADGK